MENREAIRYINAYIAVNKDLDEKEIEAFSMAISALEKQEVDKCCETCKYEHLELDAYPCCDCIRAKDHYEPYTEEES